MSAEIWGSAGFMGREAGGNWEACHVFPKKTEKKMMN